MADATLRPGAVPLRFLKMETLSYLSAPAAVFWTFVYPIALFFILNTIFGGGESPSGMGLTYTDYLITGLAVMTILSTALFGFAAVLVDMRAQQNLRILGFMPFGKFGFYIGFVGARMLILAVFLTAFMTGFGALAPDATTIGAARMVLVLAYLMCGAMALIGVSLVLTTFIAKTATAQALANIINIPAIFLSDLFLPAILFPVPLFTIISHGPFYLFVNQVRSLFAGQTHLIDAFPAMVAMLVSGVALTLWAGRRAKWHA
ncbi:ABC transporter permease [Sagittula sp. NFXS13]|uniref:ABC transporter permease n=1 Tax=Sagittula sp. NFXS13 TaxID=2819095 RepID=UPI0032DF1D67